MNRVPHDLPIELDAETVLRHQGYPDIHAVPEAVRNTFEKMKESCLALAEPDGLWLETELESTEQDAINTAHGAVFRGEGLVRALRGATDAVVFVATIGSKPEQEATRLFDVGELSEGYMLDTIASAATEQVVEYIHRRVESDAAMRGLGATHRYSPGYCDWALEEQRALFSVFGAADLPVLLTESCLMLPRKSVSGIIGIGPGLTRDDSPCTLCGKEDCMSRRPG